MICRHCEARLRETLRCLEDAAQLFQDGAISKEQLVDVMEKSLSSITTLASAQTRLHKALEDLSGS